jgi:hypothetical protein
MLLDAVYVLDADSVQHIHGVQKPKIRTAAFRKIRSTDRSIMYCEYNITNSVKKDTRWRSAFRHCAASRKVADLFHDGVTGILH